MRRDMDLIRSMLRTVADSDAPLDAHVLVDDAHPFEMVAYHADLLRQAGLADVSEVKDAGGKIVLATIGPLTWAGNDFLDAIRSDSVWSRTKRLVAARVGSASFEVLKAVAVKIATDALL